MKRKQPALVAAALPAGRVSLREVVVQLVAKTRQLNALDDEIGRALTAIEREIRTHRSSGHPVDVPFPSWGKLGWSGRRGHWRLVVLSEDGCADLCRMPRHCHVEALHVLGKLVERLGLLSSSSPGG